MEEQAQAVVTDGEAVVRTYAGMVYKLAFAQTRSRCDADDIFQEVFFRYFRKNPPFESGVHQKAWLLRVTVNCAKKHRTSAWNRKTVPLEDSLAVPPHESYGLEEALHKLPQKYRAVLHLFYYEGYPVEQIGQILKTKPSTVRTQLTRARALLRGMLKGEF